MLAPALSEMQPPFHMIAVEVLRCYHSIQACPTLPGTSWSQMVILILKSMYFYNMKSCFCGVLIKD